MSGTLNFMSPSEFQAGGPQAGSAAGIGQGVGALANVLARGPLIHAQAAHMATQDDLARAQTTGVQSDTALKQGKLARAQEAQTILGDPSALRDPVKMARLYAIGAADPELAAHLSGMVAGVASSMAFNKQIGQREADVMNAGSGAVPYQNTSSGVGDTLGNARTVAGMEITGRQNLQDTGGQWVIGDDGKPHLTQLKTATTGNMTPTTPENVRQGDAMVLARPRGAPPGTRPEAMTTRDAIARGYEVVSSAQVQAGDKPMSYNTPKGPEIGTEATAPGHAPIMTVPEAQGALYGNLLFPQQGQPSPLASTLGGGGTTPFPLPNQAPPAAPPASTPAPQQTPPTPGSPTAPAAPVVPGAAAATPAPDQFPDKLATASEAGQLANTLSSGVKTTALNPAESKAFNDYIIQAAPKLYPVGQGPVRIPRAFGPKAFAEIQRRSQAYFSSRNPSFRDNVGASVDQAIRDLQVAKTPGGKSLLPPTGTQSRELQDFMPDVKTNVIEMSSDGEDKPIATPSSKGGAPGKSAAPTQPTQPLGPLTQPTKTLIRPSDGKRIGLVNNQWVELPN